MIQTVVLFAGCSLFVLGGCVMLAAVVAPIVLHLENRKRGEP